MPTMDSSPPPPPPPTHHQRHWPLDLPSGLPFERYEHRRLTARDIIVHRIMTALFAPHNTTTNNNINTSPTLSTALAAPRQPPSRIEIARAYDAGLQGHSSKTRTSIPYHNFAGLKMADPRLARDVEVLRKMLVTRSAGEWIQQELVKPAKALAAYPEVRPPVTSFWNLDRRAAPPPAGGEQRPSVEEEVLELVRMHYMEIDDPVTRLWLGMVDAPRRSGYKTLSKMMAKQGSHKELVHKRVAWRERNEAEDYKRWYPEETAHLKTLQSQTHVANQRPLYEGGAFLPRLQRKVLESKATRAKYLNNMMEFRNQSYFTDEHNGHAIQDEVYPWPEYDAPRRVLHAPSVYSWRQKQHFFRGEMPPVDFASGRTGRGMDRDGIWSTSRWYGDDVPRGRTTRRRRRRAASEPPPEIFMAVRLPVSFNSTRELLIFSKMSLSNMERRTRRRSLSRTRIAEMFNWDITLEDPPLKPPVRPQFKELLASPPKDLARYPDYPDAIKHLKPELEKYMALWTEFCNQVEQGPRSIRADFESAWAATPPADRGSFPRPKWMVDVHGVEHLKLDEEHNDDGDTEYVRNPAPTSSEPPCTNCTSTGHQTKQCRLPCGYCGAPNPNIDYKHVDVVRNSNQFHSDDEDDDDVPKAGKHHNPHLAHQCPVARANRCKCTPFPQFHTAAKCLVLCSRPCGNTAYPPGHFKHRSAMACTSRCCMCGMRGHSGTKCKCKTCRCGGSHLGQDCRWHPACRAEGGGCGRFHCGVHCCACGLDRGQAGVVLIGRLCPACIGGDTNSNNIISVDGGGADADENGQNGKGRKRRKRNNKRSNRSDPRKTKEPKTWYAPLEPRTRPVGRC